MNVEPAYITNEVKGSFWRPDDYMMKVPGAHIIAKADNDAAQASAGRQEGATLSISEEGRKMAQDNQNSSLVFSSEDGTVRRYSYDIKADELHLLDMNA